MLRIRTMLALCAAAAAMSACDMTVTTGGSSAAASGDGTGTVPVAAYPERVYWGDLHLHTDNSIDAFGFGARLGPEQALRFARGEKVISSTGVPAHHASSSVRYDRPHPASSRRIEDRARSSRSAGPSNATM